MSKKLFSKSETIGEFEMKNLHNLVNEIGVMMTPDEYIELGRVFVKVMNRIYKENDVEPEWEAVLG